MFFFLKLENESNGPKPEELSDENDDESGYDDNNVKNFGF